MRAHDVSSGKFGQDRTRMSLNFLCHNMSSLRAGAKLER